MSNSGSLQTFHYILSIMEKIRLIVSFLLIAFSAIVVNAQEILTATLQHGDELKVFNGAGAFINAHNEAVDGDIIYLSPGTFTTTTITKAITVQGAGAITNKDAGTGITYIGERRNNGNGYTTNTIKINLPDTTHKGLVLEGIYTEFLSIEKPIKDAIIRKCHIAYTLGFTTSHNLNINQCLMAKMDIANTSKEVIVSNSRIGWLYLSYPDGTQANSTTSTLSFRNCFLGSVNSTITAFFLNNIIGKVYWYGSENNVYGYHYNKSLHSTCQAYNNLFLSSQGNANNVIQQAGNTIIDHADIYADATNYVLTEEAASTYLGQDGTQVGIYGGTTPYSLTPTYPQIIENNIAAQSTADGILKVSVKVAAQSK